MGNYEEVKQSETELAVDETQRPPRWRSWRVTVLGGALASGAVLVLNLGVLVWAMRSSDLRDGVATVYTGDCDVSSYINTFGHLVINVLGTVLLSASNNCAQLLTSPSREDITAAHRQGRWMDIGVPSLRNLRRIPRWRVLLWTLLMFSSFPLHLLYNSALSNALAYHESLVAVVTEDFARGGPWNETRLSIQAGYGFPYTGMSGEQKSRWGNWSSAEDQIQVVRHLQQEAMTGSLQNLSNEECMKALLPSSAHDYIYGNVLLLTSLSLEDNAITFQSAAIGGTYVPYTDIGTSQEVAAHANSAAEGFWEVDASDCYNIPPDWTAIRYNGTEYFKYIESAGCSTPSYCYGVPGDSTDTVLVDVSWSCSDRTAPIARCLAELYSPKCTTRIETRFLAIVVVCNIVKGVVMLVVTFGTLRPLATIGDMIASFLTSPDDPYSAHGPVSAIDARSASPGAMSKDEYSAGRLFTRRNLRWWHAANTRRFGRLAVCLVVSIALWAVASILTATAIKRAKRVDDENDTTDAMKFGLMVPQVLGTKIMLTDGAPLAMNAILPNVPQVLVSFAYLFYNNALTSMLAAYEYSRFASTRKTLRVSSPIGEQRSTYWLQLPYRYVLPLMAGMSTLHSLISRSIFLVQVDYYDFLGKRDRSSNACGFFWSPLTLALGLGVLFIVAIIGLSLRKLDPGIPLAGSCSLSISAACSAAREEEKAATKPLQYGVLMSKPCDEQGRRYVGFSSKEVAPLQDGVEYL